MNLILNQQDRFRIGVSLNQIPFKSDALVWLDGTMSGNNFVDKIGGRLFPITGMDWGDRLYFGLLPYKSAATFSAPSGDAVLIAADKNNFLYAANGTPNQISVVSMFQDIDYEHQIFVKHLPQLLNGFGVEVVEPRTTHFVIYNTPRTGNSLTKCQSWFDVPVEDLTAYWVSKTGLDTNTGTKASPWPTIQKANNSGVAGKTAYIKSGTYNEVTTTTTAEFLTINKSINYTAIGSVIITSNSTAQVMSCASAPTCTFKGLIFDSKDNSAANLLLTGTNAFEKCKFVNFKTNLGTGSQTWISTSFKNCIGIGKIKATYATQNIPLSLTSVDTSYFSHCTFTIDKLSPVFSNNYIADNDKNQTILTYTTDLSLYGNVIKYKAGGISQSAAYATLKTINIKYNKFYALGTVGGKSINYSGTINLNVSDNYFESLDATKGSSTFVGVGCNDQIINNNKFISKAQTTFWHIYAVGLRSQIKNNYSWGNALVDGQIVLGGEQVALGLCDNSVVTGNNIIGANLEHPNTLSYCHTLFVTSGVNIKTAYNRISHAGYGLIIKASSDPYTTEGVYGNIFKEVAYCINARGVIGLKIVNNTMRHTSTHNVFVAFVNCDENGATAGTQNSENILIKNNIFYTNASSGTGLSFDQWAADHGCIAQNNVIRGSAVLWWCPSINYTDLATAQAAGKLLNCIVSDPLLDANLIPATPIVIGENLGVSYKDALDTATTWGSETTPPVIVINELPEIGLVPVGAYNTLP